MGILQQARREDEADTLAVINTAMQGLQREFEKDTLADSTELGSGTTLATSFGVFGAPEGATYIEIPNTWSNSSAEVD